MLPQKVKMQRLAAVIIGNVRSATLINLFIIYQINFVNYFYFYLLCPSFFTKLIMPAKMMIDGYLMQRSTDRVLDKTVCVNLYMLLGLQLYLFKKVKDV